MIEMNAARCLGLILALAMAAVASAQDSEYYDDEGPPRATEIPTEGFWPTRTMMDRVIDRITEQMTEHYNLDEYQLERTRTLFKERFPGFLNANRAEIQTLLNQYFEAILDTEPPAVDDVAVWAQRVQPLLADFDVVVDEVTGDMREYLNDDQVVMLDAEMAAFDAGMTMAQNKLGVWSEGGYDPETEWIHPPEDRHGEDAEGEVVTEETPVGDASASETGAAEKEEVPKDEWTVYTEEFIARYQLHSEQKQKALAFLRQQQERRDKYLRNNVSDMARVTKMLTEAKTEEDREKALVAYQRLNEPIDALFEQLKERLETLPTRAQRKAAAEVQPAAEEGGTSKPAKEQITDEDREKPETRGGAEPTTPEPE